MKVLNIIEEYPDNENIKHDLEIRSHWNMTDRVVLVVDGKEHVYLATDLQRAINNAVNHR